MRNIYLVRHGQSEGNVDRAIHREKPDHALDLSPLGHQQAARAGETIADLTREARVNGRRVRIWTSPYHRTRQTAAHVLAALNLDAAPGPVDMREHPLLCEQQFGLFDGVDDADLPRLFPAEHAHYALAERHEGRFWARMPMGESRFDVAVRVHQAFGTFHRDADRHGIEDIVVICHGVTLRAFVMMWRHKTPEWFDAAPNPGNCDVYRIAADSEQDDGYVHRGG
jgi:broad specificity phosphatase PhoE